MEFYEEFKARGHENITATHPTTLEITKDMKLTPRGDCIIAVGSEKALFDFSDEIKKRIKRDDVRIKLFLKTGDLTEVITGCGSTKLSLLDKRDMVCRKSAFICKRTLMIKCDKAAKDLDKKFIEAISKNDAVIKIKISVEEKT